VPINPVNGQSFAGHSLFPPSASRRS
jgi:hypothetical protein